MTFIQDNKVRCKECYQMHPLEYQQQLAGAKHLVYRCPNRKKPSKKLLAVEFLPFIPDLAIKTYTTSNKEDGEMKDPLDEIPENQLSIFDLK